jgi:hypothetical protein
MLPYNCLPLTMIHSPHPYPHYNFSPSALESSLSLRLQPISRRQPNIEIPVSPRKQSHHTKVTNKATVTAKHISHTPTATMCREIVETYTTCPCRYDHIKLCNHALQRAPVKKFRQCKEAHYFKCRRKCGKKVVREGRCGCCSSGFEGA